MLAAMRLKLFVLAAACVLLAAPAAAAAYTTGPEPSKSRQEYMERSAKEAAEQQARENKEREEREKKAAEEKRAAEERPQHEAEERRHHEESERAEAQAREEAQRAAGEAAASQCVVPFLAGDSLGRARKALRRAHCKLGHISAPRGGHGKLVVTAQGLPAGSRRPAGTAVTVMLGPARRRRR
jgi:hypothetical protein